MNYINYSHFISVQQAAKILGVKVQTLRNWGKTGKVKSYKCPINGYRLYNKEDLEEILKKIKVEVDGSAE